MAGLGLTLKWNRKKKDQQILNTPRLGVKNKAIGFTTRGCPNACGFCIKEGSP